MIKVEVEVSGEQERKLRSCAREPTRDRKILYDRAATLIGAFEDPEGAKDLSAEHDRYLGAPSGAAGGSPAA